MKPQFTDFGLPTTEQFAKYRIWDSYYHPHTSVEHPTLTATIADDLATLAPFAIEKFCTYFHVGLGTARTSAANKAHNLTEIRRLLETQKDKLLGFIFLNPKDVEGSLRALDEWVANGPAVGVFFLNNRNHLRCTHPNFFPLVKRASELGAIIMQHTWFKAGGREFPEESTPSDLAELAAKFPEANLCAVHAGGDWAQGVRAVRAFPNVTIETSGFDPTQGFIEMAVRDLGAERIMFGGHFMSRSVATEFSKILGDEIGEANRRLIFGGTLRRILGPILRKKGMRVD